MSTISVWAPLRGTTLQDQVNRFFSNPAQGSTAETDLATWTPAVDIYETEAELVVKADLPDLDEKEIDVQVEKNILTVRGERKFEKNVTEDNYLRVERTYGAFTRSFSLPDTINSEQIQAQYRNGVLTVHLPKREESKPKQIKVNVSADSAK